MSATLHDLPPGTFFSYDGMAYIRLTRAAAVEAATLDLVLFGTDQVVQLLPPVKATFGVEDGHAGALVQIRDLVNGEFFVYRRYHYKLVLPGQAIRLIDRNHFFLDPHAEIRRWIVRR